MARRYLRFSIDEWLALPWWQRRVYLEGINNEAEEREDAANGGGNAQQNASGGGGWADTVLGGGNPGEFGLST